MVTLGLVVCCVVAARCCRVVGAWNSKEAEALSLKEALSWIIALQYDHCVFETDSRCLAMACNENPGEDYFGTIVVDCIQLLKHISSVLVEFVYRSANSAAHVLAKAAYFMSGLQEWYDHPPAFLISVLASDLS